MNSWILYTKLITLPLIKMSTTFIANPPAKQTLTISPLAQKILDNLNFERALTILSGTYDSVEKGHQQCTIRGISTDDYEVILDACINLVESQNDIAFDAEDARFANEREETKRAKEIAEEADRKEQEEEKKAAEEAKRVADEAEKKKQEEEAAKKLAEEEADKKKREEEEDAKKAVNLETQAMLEDMGVEDIEASNSPFIGLKRPQTASNEITEAPNNTAASTDRPTGAPLVTLYLPSTFDMALMGEVFKASKDSGASLNIKFYDESK